MNNSATITCLSLAVVLALAVGCSKTDNPATPAGNADKTVQAEKIVPPKASEESAKQVSPPSTANPDNAVAAVATTAKSADAIATPAIDSVSKIVATVKPATNSAPNPAAQAMTGLAGLSQDQMVKGLQDALGKGLKQAIANLGHDGGFLTNLNVKIPMPDKLQKVETALRAMKQDKLADDFVATMNHAAEQAVPEAGSVFGDALRQMTIDDAKSILTGPNDAATQYFQKTTETNLYAKFYPIVQKATEKTGVTAAYKKVMEKADLTKSLGGLGSALGGSLLDKDSLDVDAYVTHKTMDGLFKMVAEEEKQIRQNPVARTTDVLQKVFGALKL